MTRRVCAPHHNWPTFVYYFGIIIIIIIINEKINVAFSRRTARTRNSHKKNKSRENVVSNSTEEEKNVEWDVKPYCIPYYTIILIVTYYLCLVSR